MRYVILMLLASAANASGFYVEGGAAVLEASQQHVPTVITVELSGHDTATFMACNCRRYDLNDVSNPVGTFALGYDFKWRAVVIDFQLQHQSMLLVGDHGENSARLHVRWYPFH